MDSAMPKALRRGESSSAMLSDALNVTKSSVSNQDVFLLFVTYDRNLNGALDPDEVEALWGYLIGSLKNALPQLIEDYAKNVHVAAESVEQCAIDLLQYLQEHEVKEKIDEFYNMLANGAKAIYVNQFVERFESSFKALVLDDYEKKMCASLLEPQLRAIDAM
jgi:hypothetical protein